MTREAVSVRSLPVAGPVVSAVSVAAGGALAGLRDVALVLVLFVLVALGTAIGTRRLAVATLDEDRQLDLVRRSTGVALLAGATVFVVLLALVTLAV